MKKKCLLIIVLLAYFLDTTGAQLGTISISKTVNAGEKISIFTRGFINDAGGVNLNVSYKIESDVKDWFFIEVDGEKTEIIRIPANGRVKYTLYAKVPKNAKEGEYFANISLFGVQGTILTSGIRYFIVILNVTNKYQRESESKLAFVKQRISDLTSMGINAVQLDFVLNEAQSKYEESMYSEALNLLKQIEQRAQELEESFLTELKNAIDGAKNELDKAEKAGIEIADEKSKLKMIEDNFGKGIYESIESDTENLKKSIIAKIGKFNDASNSISNAKDRLAELEKMSFASTEEARYFIEKAESMFKGKDYVGANDMALKAITEIENEKNKAEEKMSALSKTVPAIVIVLIVIVILLVRRKVKTKRTP